MVYIVCWSIVDWGSVRGGRLLYLFLLGVAAPLVAHDGREIVETSCAPAAAAA